MTCFAIKDHSDPELTSNSCDHSYGNIFFIQHRPLFNMDFKITQPIFSCNRIFTQVIYITSYFTNHFFKGNPCCIFCMKSSIIK